MSAPEIDSSNWTGVSDSDKQGDGWLPEEIVPRLRPRQAYIDLLRFASLFILVASVIFYVRGGSEKQVLIEIFDIAILNVGQLWWVPFGIISFLILYYYMKHIRKCARFGTWVKFDRHGISCRERKRHVKWTDVASIRVNSSWGRHRMSVTKILVFLKPKNEEEAQAIFYNSLGWRLDGTDVDFDLLERATKRWHELAQARSDAQTEDGSLKDC